MLLAHFPPVRPGITVSHGNLSDMIIKSNNKFRTTNENTQEVKINKNKDLININIKMQNKTNEHHKHLKHNRTHTLLHDTLIMC